MVRKIRSWLARWLRPKAKPLFWEVVCADGTHLYDEPPPNWEGTEQPMPNSPGYPRPWPEYRHRGGFWHDWPIDQKD